MTNRHPAYVDAIDTMAQERDTFWPALAARANAVATADDAMQFFGASENYNALIYRADSRPDDLPSWAVEAMEAARNSDDITRSGLVWAACDAARAAWNRQ